MSKDDVRDDLGLKDKERFEQNGGQGGCGCGGCGCGKGKNK